MKYILSVSVLFFMMIACGCQEQTQPSQSGFPDVEMQKTCLFMPEKIKFNQLTEFSQDWQITAYIDILDQFGSRIKAAGIWKFELYEYVLRSSEPKGTRLYFWPDINLTDAKVNFGYWQDYLRCYKFDLNLDFDLAGGKTYILQAECFTADGKRITDSIELKH
jgi:hypothetical protein